MAEARWIEFGDDPLAVRAFVWSVVFVAWETIFWLVHNHPLANTINGNHLTLFVAMVATWPYRHRKGFPALCGVGLAVFATMLTNQFAAELARMPSGEFRNALLCMGVTVTTGIAVHSYCPKETTDELAHPDH